MSSCDVVIPGGFRLTLRVRDFFGTFRAKCVCRIDSFQISESISGAKVRVKLRQKSVAIANKESERGRYANACCIDYVAVVQLQLDVNLARSV